METLKQISKKTLLVILDGFGINSNTTKNAVKDAKTPNIDYLFANFPYTTIEAGGESVGLPKGVSGNSEVGHMNLGAGRPVRQDLVRINEVIEQDKFKDLELLQEFKKKAKTSTKRIHIVGLLSDGGVHSHINHIKEVINSLKDDSLSLHFHAFMDGRDTQKNIGQKYIDDLSTVDGFQFASMQGRSIGMDRDRRWEKIKACYDMMIGQGAQTNLSPTDYLANEYKEERFDEFINPVLFNKDFAIQDGDSVFFINFRPDRAIQFTLAMTDPNFNHFERSVLPGQYLCMTPYCPEDVELPILFDKEKLNGVLSEYLSQNNYKQYKIAETEKYAHVTFFFNGGEKKPFPGEEHILVNSPKEVATYDLKPEMSAPEVTEKLLAALEDDYTFYIVNFANSDMVGHTGNYEAAIKAVETLDHSVKQLIDQCEKNDITLLLTADHGNSDQMVYEDGSPHTSHTGAPVPFCAFHPKLKGKKLAKNGDFALKDVAPTILYSLGIDYPSSFEGESIFK
tara:strand:- start:4195 stop:5721 length:1527 start_codon:yes stop_codon:yes gene_type:complete